MLFNRKIFRFLSHDVSECHGNSLLRAVKLTRRRNYENAGALQTLPSEFVSAVEK